MKTFTIDVEFKEWAHLETMESDIVEAIKKEIDSVSWVEIEEVLTPEDK